VAGATERREFCFELGHLRAENELTTGKDAGDRIIDPLAQLATLCGNVDQRQRGRIKGRVKVHRGAPRRKPRHSWQRGGALLFDIALDRFPRFVDPDRD
jgi:hypothetical protein